MTRKEEIENAANAYYGDTWDEHGGIAMVVGNHHHDVWFPSCATDDFFKAGAEWADQTMLEKACNAYCEVCGHFAHDVPTHICRHDCRYYDDFRKLLKQ